MLDVYMSDVCTRRLQERRQVAAAHAALLLVAKLLPRALHYCSALLTRLRSCRRRDASLLHLKQQH
jgi:hypothetical protein